MRTTRKVPEVEVGEVEAVEVEAVEVAQRSTKSMKLRDVPVCYAAWG